MTNRTIDHLLAAHISGNTNSLGTGTEYRLVCDNNGYLQVDIVGGPGSFHSNAQDDDDAIALGEIHESVIAILYAKDPTGVMERVLTDGSGRIQTTAVVIAPGAYNAETDDDSVPAGEDHESNIVILYGYDPVGTDWERVHTDSNHRLLIADGGGSITVDGTFWPVTQPISAVALPLPAGASTSAIQTTMDTSLNNIETDAAAIEVLITAGNVDLAAIEVLITAGNVDLAAIEALQITIDASLNEIEDATENLEEALQSIGTDYLLIGDAGSPINLDAAGDVQVDVLSMPVVAVTGTFWQVTQPISAVALPLPAGAATSAIQTTMNTSLNEIEDAIENLEESLASIGTDYLLIGDAGAIIHLDAAGDPQVDVLTMPVVAVTGTFWQVTQPVSGTFWQVTQPISAAALPLPAGAATEASLQGCETALQIMDDWDSGNRCKVEIDQVDAVYNPETDDGQIPDGEVHDSVIAVLYAYNTSATDLKRVLVNDSGALMVYTP